MCLKLNRSSFVTLITLGWSIFGTRLLHEHQQWTLGVGCVSRQEGLQCKNTVHWQHEQVRPGNKTTIKWCEWTDSERHFNTHSAQRYIYCSLHLVSPQMFDSVADIVKFHTIFPITLISGRNMPGSRYPENCVLTCPITKRDVDQLLK